MRFVILLFSVILMACSGAETSTETANTETTDAIERPSFQTNYAVIADESRLAISSTQEGEPFEGVFSEFDAMIRFDADALETSRVWVAVPIDGLEAGTADRNNTARAKGWLNAKETPLGVFESETIRADGDGFVADGMLTLRGTSLPFSLPFTLEQTGDRAVMSASVPLERLRWGVGEEWNSGNYVGLTVTLDIRVVAEKV